MIRSYQALFNRILIFADTIMIVLAMYAAWYMKFQTGWLDSSDWLGVETYVTFATILLAVFLLANAMVGLYSKGGRNLKDDCKNVAKSTIATVLVLMSVLFFVKEIHISRELILMFATISFVLLTCVRFCTRMVLRRMSDRGYYQKYMLVLGAGPLGRKVLNMADEEKDFGFQVIGFLDDRLYSNTSQVDNVPLLGTLDDLEKVLNENTVDQVVLALPIGAHHRVGQLIATCEKAGVQALIIPDYFNYLPAKPRFEEVNGIPMIDVRNVPLDNAMKAGVKRLFDIGFSLFVLLMLLPLFTVIAMGIKLTSRGPMFFTQERVGKNRRIFKMYKFRSMKVSTSEVSNQNWTVQNDPRKTKFGSFLRKTSVDELPQFYNVLIGDMSIIGPRPERPYFVDQFKENIPMYMLKHRVRPGITGWAQVNGWRGDTSIEERIKCDIDYIENWTFGFDLKIVVKTIINGFVNKNAY